MERGEERFTVEWDRADESVSYEVFAFARPAHPYTRSLLASVPQLHHKWERTGHGVPEPAGESA